MAYRLGARFVAIVAIVVLVFTGCAVQQVGGVSPLIVARNGVREDATGHGPEHRSSHAFLDADVGDPQAPVGWFDSCAPIRYRISTVNVPEGGVEEIQEAVARIGQASGYAFVFAGFTDEVPTSSYGRGFDQVNRFPPVLLAWGDEATVNRFDSAGALAGEAVGVGGPARIPLGDGTLRYVSGAAMVSSEIDDGEVRGFDDRWSTGQSWLHELGHVLGLGHTGDSSQAMYERLDTAQGFGSGDIEGLRKLAAMPCRDEWAAVATAG